MATKQPYRVLSNLDFDNKGYKPGKTVELDDETAAQLLSDGVVEKAVKGDRDGDGKPDKK